MIKIEKIEIKEFRGIRNLTLSPAGKNFAVCGPNGTGKSGVVDAIEFCLTGSISRLAGRGTGDISVQAHAPHVDSRTHPEKARVIITALIPSLKKQVVIERSVKDPSNPKITPDNPAIRELLRQVAVHSEFVLSRRELVRYILSTPGDRSKEVQALLRLDQVESLRTTLLRIANRYKRNIEPLEGMQTQKRELLTQALEVPKLSKEALLDSVNRRRAILKLPVITTLNPTTSVKEGLTTIASKSQQPQILKRQIVSDIKKLNATLQLTGSTETTTSCKKLSEELSNFASDPIALQGVERERFLRTALTLLDDKACPVCDTPWDINELKAIVEAKLKHFDAISRRRIELEKKIKPIASLVRSLQESIKVVQEYNVLPADSAEAKVLGKFEASCEATWKALESFLPIPDTIKALKALQTTPPGILNAISKLEGIVAKIPDPTEQDAAKYFLVLAQERLESYRSIQTQLKVAESHAQLAEKVSTTFVNVSTNILNNIYKKVQEEFSELYRFVNRDDESGFSAKLIPSAGKLGFDVDFYGRGPFPPGAYHSEGHQDGMGFCLYLALMKHLLGNAFTLAVLDDVLMSVDSQHRREVCALLTKHFPNTQFILTTHDRIWLQHMKSEGLIGENAALQFRTWDVAHGPTKWDQMDVWKEIDTHLKGNDVRSAAGVLRHFLEYMFGEICHRLRVQVEHRGDAQFQLEDLLPNAIHTFRELLEDGQNIAISWKQEDEIKKLRAQKTKFSGTLKDIGFERWQLNAAVHFNDWDNLTKKDFAPVATAFHKLVDCFRCSTCESFFKVIPNRGPKETLKCVCGDTNINLQKPKGTQKEAKASVD